MEVQENYTTIAARNGTLPIEDFDPPKISALDLLLILAPHKKMIIGLAIAGAILAGIQAFNQRDAYTATAVIVLPQQQRSSLASLVGQLTPIGAVTGGGDFLRAPSDLYISLMSSRTMADGLIDDFHLQQRYEAENITTARQVLAGRTTFTGGKDFLIRIAVIDRDPKFAAVLANAYVDRLHQLNSRMALTESGQRRLFFEQQLQAEKQALAEAEAEMKTTQERTGLVQVNSQMEVVLRSIAQLRAEITSREVLLETLKAGATEKNPEVVRLQVELSSLRGQLGKAESNPGARAGGVPKLGPGNAPALSLEYLRRLRDFQYHETLFETLAKQYEAARLDEAKEAPVVQVVDQAVPPEERNPKHRVFIVLFGAMSLGILGCCIALFRHAMAEPVRAERIREIKRALWTRQPAARFS